MDLVLLTEQIVKSVVKNPDMISVKKFDTEEDGFILIQVMVDSEDMGRVIGREGKIANAIRTLVQASAYLQNQKVKVNIDSF